MNQINSLLLMSLSLVCAYVFWDVDNRLDALEDQAPMGACTTTIPTTNQPQE
jgi:hypothetical protein